MPLDFRIKHHSANSIGYADALSRFMNAHQKPQEDSVVAAISMETEIISVITTTVIELPVTLQMVG